MDATPVLCSTFLPTMLLVGLGFALGYAALNVQATAGVADHEQGLAAGLVQTSFQMGGAIVPRRGQRRRRRRHDATTGPRSRSCSASPSSASLLALVGVVAAAHRRGARHRRAQIQPMRRAMATASCRLAAPSLVVALER